MNWSHSSFNHVLNVNDGSAQFATDATFKMAPGLANSSWTSFQSYNVSDRYTRHYKIQLQISPVFSSIDQADVTFRVTL